MDMVKLGYKLMTETHGPRELIRNARLAEEAGFDFAAISDHYHPWLESHGHSPFAWSVLGAIASNTEKIGLATGLTCPIMRYHPAIVAQAAATIGVISGGRFTLAVGAGERLNEHVVGHGWPAVHERHAMLREAIEIIRLLWRGETCSYKGAHFHLDSARIYDLPDKPISIVMGVSEEKSLKLATEMADGIMATEAKPETVKAWKKAKGSKGPRYAELGLAYADTEKAGLKIAHTYSRFGALGWSVLSELPSVSGFEDATRFVKPDDLKDEIPHGPDVETYVKAVKKFVDAGYDHIALMAAGPDQEKFIRFFAEELAPRLRKLRA